MRLIIVILLCLPLVAASPPTIDTFIISQRENYTYGVYNETSNDGAALIFVTHFFKDPTLIAYWNMNPSNGSLFNGTDLTGNGNTLTNNSGSPVQNLTGGWDGSPATTIKKPSAARSPILRWESRNRYNLTLGFGFCTWLSMNETENSQFHTLMKLRRIENTTQGLGLDQNSGEPTPLRFRADTRSSSNVNANIGPEDGRYHHICLTYNRTHIRAWYDGNNTRNTTLSGEYILTNISFQVGDGSNANFTVDDTYIFNRTIDQLDVDGYYKHGMAFKRELETPNANLTAYMYAFDGNLTFAQATINTSTCVYNGSGDWYINAGEFCNITAPVQMNRNAVLIYGNGFVKGWRSFYNQSKIVLNQRIKLW